MAVSSPARVLATRLVFLNLGRLPPATSATNWYVYTYREPTQAPDSTITVFDDGTVPQFGRMRGGRWRGNPAVQIRFRTRLYEDGWAKGQDIMDSLADLKMTHVTVPGDSTTWVVQRFTPDPGGEPRWIQQLEYNTLQVFVINGTLTLLGKDM